MKRHLIYLFASAALFAAGCTAEPAEKGFGRLSVVCSADDRIEIRPQSRTTGLIEADEFVLNIKGGESYDKSWETVAAFRTEDPLIKEGEYTASVTYGDPEVEGAGKPCYFGEKEFTIVARQTSEVEIVARIANAQAVIRATDQFMAYFNDIRLSLTTGSGNEFAYNLDAGNYVEIPVFVKAATSLTVGGKARRQSQNGTAQGVEVTFDDQTFPSTAAATRYTFKFDARDAGSATLSIFLDEEFLEERTLSFELNDDATLDPIP